MSRERAAGRDRGSKGWLLLCVAGLGGCIGAPGIPGGPLQGTGFSMSGSYGYAMAPAQITMRSASDGRQANFQDRAADALNFPVLPARLGGRVGLSRWFDAAGDFSWLDSGFELRTGLPEGTQPFPIALSLSVRRGAWGAYNSANRHSTEQRLRLEAYPRLTRWPNGARLNLVSSLGVSTGRHFHPLQLPDRFDRDYGRYEGNQEGPMIPVPDLKTFDTYLYRDETRVEGSLGIELRQGRFFSSLVLMPYGIAKSSDALAGCARCADWQIQRFESSFGAAFFFTFGVAILTQGSD